MERFKISQAHTNAAHGHARKHSQLARQSKTKSSDSLPAADNSNQELIKVHQQLATKHKQLSKDLLTQEQRDDDDWHMLDMSGLQLSAVSPQLLTYCDTLTVLYLNHNNLQHVPSCFSQLHQLTVLDLSHNFLKSLPVTVSQMQKLVELWLYDNQLMELPVTIGLLHDLKHLGLEGNPVFQLYGNMLDESKREGLAILKQRLVDNIPQQLLVPYKIPARHWIPFTGQQSDLRVVSYNILSERYASQSSYWYCPAYALDATYRLSRIDQILKNLVADSQQAVLCLQEVESSAWRDIFMRQWMQDYGEVECANDIQVIRPATGAWDGLFMPKSRWRTMSARMRDGNTGTGVGKSGADGCVIMWQTSAFRMIYEPITVEFARLGMTRPDFIKDDQLFTRFLARDNVAVGVVLQSVHNSRHVVLVVNAHIFWNPECTDVKLVQCVMLMQEIDQFSKRFLIQYPHYKQLPLVLCGDFNSVPQSLVYDYLTGDKSMTNIDQHVDLAQCFGGGAIPRSDTQDDPQQPQLAQWPSWSESGYGLIAKQQSLRHQLTSRIKSSCQVIERQNVYDGKHVGLPFTNHTPTFTDVIDYVFHSTQQLHVTRVLGGYALDDTGHSEIQSGDSVYMQSPMDATETDQQAGWSIKQSQCIGLPNPVMPSDHIPVAAEFKFQVV